MNKIGVRESCYTIIFLMIPQFVINALTRGLSAFNSAYVINLFISFILFYVIVLLSKRAFFTSCLPKYEILDKAIDFVFLVYIFSLTLYNYNLSTNAVLSASHKTFAKDIIAFLPLVSAAICSLLGMESISRASYINFFAVGFIMALMMFLTFDGWDRENIYPLLGKNLNKIFIDNTSFAGFSGLVGIYMLKDNFKDNGATYTVLKKSLIISFIFALVLSVVCIFIIPYPMGELYGFSLEGIFSMAKSGSFFHRFELLLIIMILISDIVSVSLGLYLISFTVSKLCKSKDYKPFVMIFAVILFCLNLIIENLNFLFNIYFLSVCLLLVFLVIKSQVFCKIFRKE